MFKIFGILRKIFNFLIVLLLYLWFDFVVELLVFFEDVDGILFFRDLFVFFLLVFLILIEFILFVGREIGSFCILVLIDGDNLCFF